jgi:heme oxygenase (biliverdin-IX-beta and delta-forming)
MSVADAARRFLRAQRSGTLSTVSARHTGYPFGSVVPFALDTLARPVLLISALAEHTRNLAADPHTSLVVHAYAEDVQAGPRLTVVGDAEPIGDRDAACDRYLRRFPDAARFVALGDFSFHAIVPRELLFVQGFGRIDWISANAFAPPQGEVAEAEADILAHLNTEHTETLRLYCRAHADVDAETAEAIGIDCDGIDVRAGKQLIRFDFDAPALDAAAVRARLISLAERARAG